jgi:ORF3
MTATQNVLFSLALLHANVEEDYADATFYKDDVERFLEKAKFSNGDATRILKDVQAVGTNSILMYDEKILTNPDSGKMKGFLIFADYSYDNGKYYFSFNTTKTKWGGTRITPILDVLKRNEVNPIVYNLSTFAKLSFGGKVLYEQILLATNNGKRELVYDLEGLRGIFGAEGKSMERFDTLNRKHLTPAVQKINEESGIGVVFDTIKQSRKIVGVKIKWTREKVRIPATEAQIAIANELIAEITLLGSKNVELIDLLREVSKMTCYSASKLIEEALAYKKAYEDDLRENDKKLQKAIESKQIKEAEKKASLSQNSKPIEVAVTETNNESEEEAHLAEYFKKHNRLSKKNRALIVEIAQSFEPTEALEMLELADNIKVWENGKIFGFIVTTLREWADNGVKTLKEEAEEFYKVNYNDILEKAPSTAKTKSKESKSNVPKWSNPDYVNEASPEYIEKLIETQKILKIYKTPEGKAELAEALEKQAMLESQSKSLQERVNKL